MGVTLDSVMSNDKEDKKLITVAITTGTEDAFLCLQLCLLINISNGGGYIVSLANWILNLPVISRSLFLLACTGYICPV